MLVYCAVLLLLVSLAALGFQLSRYCGSRVRTGLEPKTINRLKSGEEKV